MTDESSGLFKPDAFEQIPGQLALDSEASELVERAQERARARERATPRIDYARMNREGRRLKAALTRAKNSGDPSRVVKACAEAVRVWDEVGAWPDNWPTWRVALWEATHYSVELEDLR